MQQRPPTSPPTPQPDLIALRGPQSGRLYGYFDRVTGELVVKDRGHHQIERIDLRRLLEDPHDRT